MRYFIRLSFNGSDYHGWQIQDNARSVQEEINKALSLLLKENVLTTGCGRTDTGVHARKFYAHFDTEKNFDADQLVYHLNAMLPISIAVQRIFPVDQVAHARFSALERTYHYHIHTMKDPFIADHSWYYPHALDKDRMNAFASILLHYTDFTAFSKSNTQTFTNNCKIMFAQWEENEGKLIFTITADRFLRNMVRAIVGTLIKAGSGRLTEEEFRAIIESKDRSNAGTSVPAHGLYLTEINYPFSTN